eukprot:CAMPEP_0167780340 /NCGR_PEP_ID=MMETSP0111_2-20121227/5298_1 /TAXON_ID=91324 /ORGANISM="Lotharella globosa, Strain CCCM811" /LENGTH=89 /DNA_ID=CAMNT_0007670831 /DNA_START=345 /DNA_END=614 /DNA_ORIENTATION=-
MRRAEVVIGCLFVDASGASAFCSSDDPLGLAWGSEVLVAQSSAISRLGGIDTSGARAPGSSDDPVSSLARGVKSRSLCTSPTLSVDLSE